MKKKDKKMKDKSLQDGLDALDRDRAASLADEGGGTPHSEGEDVDDTTPTPARPLPAITPAVDDRHA